MMTIEEIQKVAKESVDNVVKSAGSTTKGVQAIATEVAEYQKRAFEQGTAALEKVFASKTIDKAFEVQTDYVKSAYEGAVAEMTKVNAMYADLAKEMYKPYEAMFGKFGK